ncbi:YncE family protein [Formosa sp. L2A11]|uniref:YncE family protein n=1 Tax=Formosa sp. L2A11 TaxID=2686363 RepID=UPI00131E3C98|nr:quinoprotein amine dehydrogenase [Formosa sp. L2A11]
MKQINKFFTIAFASAALFSSCSSDSDDDITTLPKGDYDNGYIVLNEGQFGTAGTAGISFVGDDKIIENDVYTTVNPDATDIGNALQNIFFDDDNAYIISGSANQVTVVDRYTFEYKATIDTDLVSPRYGAIANGKAYVTNSNGWDDGSDDFVTVIDLSDYSTTTFDMKVAEKVIEEDGILYFANGYYGSGQQVTVYNPSTEESVEIDLGDGNTPNSIVEEDDALYVLTTNYNGTANIFEISMSSNTITDTIDLTETAPNAKQLTIEDDTLYFTNATTVFALDINGTTPTEILSYTSTSAFGAMYGFAVEDDTIYIADAGDFASAGTTYEYSLTGTLLNTFTAGIAPNGFYFND